MKKLITIIILISITTLAPAQTLMLSVQRSVVKAEMRRVEGFTLTDSLPDFLQYKRGSQTIAYEFEKVGWWKWICITASITMPKEDSEAFVLGKLDCNCWKPTGPNTWLYETNVFDSPVIVQRTSNNNNTITFTYKLSKP